jgi:acyl carrier protein
VPSTFAIVADIIAQTCHISHETIALDSDLHDLGIDSLDLLDIGFALDDAFGIRVPLEQWLHAAQMKRPAERCLIVRELCASIDTMMDAAAARTACCARP